jgi:hypothetical protein
MNTHTHKYNHTCIHTYTCTHISLVYVYTHRFDARYVAAYYSADNCTWDNTDVGYNFTIPDDSVENWFTLLRPVFMPYWKLVITKINYLDVPLVLREVDFGVNLGSGTNFIGAWGERQTARRTVSITLYVWVYVCMYV